MSLIRALSTFILAIELVLLPPLCMQAAAMGTTPGVGPVLANLDLKPRTKSPGPINRAWLAMNEVDTSARHQMLFGFVEYNDFPQVEAFMRLVAGDQNAPCNLTMALPRLRRVAYDANMRELVWKRMQRQELLYVPTKELKRVEGYARDCNMPLLKQSR